MSESYRYVGGYPTEETVRRDRPLRPREVVLSGADRIPGDVPPESGAGSLYWLGLRDADGSYLDGAHPYTLDVPQPVPAKLFWSITVYDAETRSEILTEQGNAALRSMNELSDVDTTAPVRLHFGPTAPASGSDRWIRTIPGKGWFVYFRIYGPDEPAFDGTWRLPDFIRR
ncbi:DUF1214 domain-containing protein [Rhodococcus sp. (in: high G+C Gram-positive bacteria)]|uniref:DUF1214 domain-containing protein n=1 Tax=Rhodococcus sp. TaxID=1831 RepID=UPI001A19B839|nr:DUF1214 domain-containing protein [Rhodococcus sp. (in: high G+C Gram-positive bacteria)]MBJ7479743.1 DUF1214 domain-containing protein [Rhodococcus sp. (in: high G+C Gram-positive bacteria)]